MFEKSAPDPFALRRKANGTNSAEGDSVEDYGAFGWLRGLQDRAIMLEIRLKDGRIKGRGYSWLQGVDFDGDGTITLNFSGETVTIKGRNLNGEARSNVRLLAGLLRHRVPWIQEADGADVLEAAKDKVVIEEVKIK